jgi:hypothetical protein
MEIFDLLAHPQKAPNLKTEIDPVSEALCVLVK